VTVTTEMVSAKVNIITTRTTKKCLKMVVKMKPNDSTYVF